MNISMLGFGGFTIFVSVLIVIVAVLAVVEAFAGIANWIATYRYLRYGKISAQMNGEETANYLLKTLGMEDVQVKKPGFFRSLFLGNSYSISQKTIYLRKRILTRKSVASMAVASQKVALAIQHKNNDKRLLRKSKLDKIAWGAPISFIPLFLIGLIIDFITTSNIGILTVVFSAIGVLYFLIAVIILGLTIPVEKKANADALQLIEQTGIMSETEMIKTKKLYKSMIVAYIANFITSLIYLIKMLFKLLGAIAKISKK